VQRKLPWKETHPIPSKPNGTITAPTPSTSHVVVSPAPEQCISCTKRIKTIERSEFGASARRTLHTWKWGPTRKEIYTWLGRRRKLAFISRPTAMGKLSVVLLRNPLPLSGCGVRNLRVSWFGDLATQVRERRTMNLMPRSAYVPEKYELLVATTSCKEQGQRKNEIYDRHTQRYNNQEWAQSIHD